MVSATTTESACVAGTCVLCLVALPLAVLVGLFAYVLLLGGVAAGIVWGAGSAIER